MTAPLDARAVEARARRRVDATTGLLELVGDLLVLNVLWLVTCAMVLPAAAGTAAMARVTATWTHSEVRRPVRELWAELVAHGPAATWVGAQAAVLGAVLATDLLLVTRMSPVVGRPLLAALVVLVGASVAVCAWLPHALADGRRGRGAWREAARRAAALAAVALVATVLAVVVLSPTLVLVVPAPAAYAWARLASPAPPVG